jgi:hypothetical protein
LPTKKEDKAMSNKLDQVIYAISKMDTLLLSEVLDPNTSFQDVELGVFLRQLESIFKEFKKDGDNELISLEGTCVNFDCNPNLNRTTFRFYGRESRDYIDFRFILEPIKVGKDYGITDIFQCHCFNCQIEQSGWYREEKYLFFYWDEKNDFSTIPDFILHKETAIKAMEYWDEIQNQTINFDEVGAWLMKYQSTYDFAQKFQRPPLFEKMSWDRFGSTYETLSDYFEIIPKVVQLFRLFDIKEGTLSEKELIDIILKFENYFGQTGYDYFINHENDRNELGICIGVKILIGKNIDQYINWWNWFGSTREKLVKKYFALSDGELDQIHENEGLFFQESELERLGFHMDIRERARQNGEYIPLR